MAQHFKKPMKLLFLGAPGVGKGTYSSRLSKQWQIPHISTGDMIRAEIKSESQLGKEFKSYSDNGALVPDELVVAIAKNRLTKSDAQQGFILDGFPRTIEQAEQLSEFSDPVLCLNLTIPDELLVTKLSGRRVCTKCGNNYNIADIHYGEYNMPPLLPTAEDIAKCPGCDPAKLEQRTDDKEDIVKSRLMHYYKETAPLVEYYKKKGILITFDVKKGVQDLPAIGGAIANELNH